MPVDLLRRRHFRITPSTGCGLQLAADTKFEIVKANDDDDDDDDGGGCDGGGCDDDDGGGGDDDEDDDDDNNNNNNNIPGLSRHQVSPV